MFGRRFWFFFVVVAAVFVQVFFAASDIYEFLYFFLSGSTYFKTHMGRDLSYTIVDADTLMMIMRISNAVDTINIKME